MSDDEPHPEELTLPDDEHESSGEYRSPGSVKLGPFIISARFSIVLIFFIVIGINLLLLLGVVLAAMYRAGRF